MLGAQRKRRPKGGALMRALLLLQAARLRMNEAPSPLSGSPDGAGERNWRSLLYEDCLHSRWPFYYGTMKAAPVGQTIMQTRWNVRLQSRILKTAVGGWAAKT